MSVNCNFLSFHDNPFVGTSAASSMPDCTNLVSPREQVATTDRAKPYEQATCNGRLRGELTHSPQLQLGGSLNSNNMDSQPAV